MRYTGPKFKLCRREGINLFGTSKYDIRKRRKLPGQHGGSMSRLSEYGKLLRNKQALKRMYFMTEKQFYRLVMKESLKYSKNKGLEHDKAVLQFLERRLDSIVLKSGFANTIAQARQIVSHGHLLVNGKKHNVPSYFVNKGDIIEVKDKVKTSPLYSNVPISTSNYNYPSWLNVDKDKLKAEVIDFPKVEEVEVPVDVLKVIEFYARG